jgi:hypothetical protein
MDVRLAADRLNTGYRLSAYMSGPEVADTQGMIVRRAIEIVADRLAEQFLNDHGADILAALDPQAIANLAIADSGRAVREALEKSIPREVQHHHHTNREVYKVGLFGGMKRL